MRLRWVIVVGRQVRMFMSSPRSRSAEILSKHAEQTTGLCAVNLLLLKGFLLFPSGSFVHSVITSLVNDDVDETACLRHQWFEFRRCNDEVRLNLGYSHAFLRRSLRGRSCFPSPVQVRQPRIAGAVDARPRKLRTPKAPRQHGRRESAAGSTPHRSEYCPSSGAFCAGEEGLPGDAATISYYSPLVFVKLLTISGLVPQTPSFLMIKLFVSFRFASEPGAPQHFSTKTLK